ncbi:MAG: thioredoxin [SAR116 cluster bacterium]|nr:thioredoxin [SAR116 cluster bacterium]RPH09451.1 MAG: thioredoxin [Alphaproteobacteria bacterium TMED54]
MTVLNTTDNNFKNDVLESSKPVLVDFWAEWCGPCKSIAPALEEISNEMSQNITIAKINIDENPNIAQEYNIRSIPALMIFKEGKLHAEMMGAIPKSQLENWINEHI